MCELIVGKVYSGEKFNELTKGIKLVRLTVQGENHNGLQYTTGLNIDHIPFNPRGTCSPGGMYFCNFEYFYKYLVCNDGVCINLRIVTVPDDAKVYIEDHKYKTDKFILSDPIKIFDNYELCLKIVKYNGNFLKYAKYKTLEICLEAVRQNGYALRYVEEQTEELCLEAVKQNSLALEYVKEQTYEMCLEAVKQNGRALECVKEQTEEICLEAVKKNYYALEYVKEQTEEICLEAVKQNGYALEYVKEKTENIHSAAIKQKIFVLKYIC